MRVASGALTTEALAYLSVPGSSLDYALGGRFWFVVSPGLPLREVDGRAVASLLRSERLKPATQLHWDELAGAVVARTAANRWCLQ
jgi:hypothetical protein